MQDTLNRQGAPRPGIQAIARAGRVLRALEAAPGGLGLAELAAAVSLPKSTVHRLSAALAAEELVATAPGGRIVLGGGLARLAAGGRGRAAGARCGPRSRRSRGETGETVDLAVLDGDGVRFVDQLAGPQRLRAVSAVGEEFPLYCTANGKALLAALGPDRARALLPGAAAAPDARTRSPRTARSPRSSRQVGADGGRVRPRRAQRGDLRGRRAP